MVGCCRFVGVVVRHMDLMELGCVVSALDNAVTGCCRCVDVVVTDMDLINMGCNVSP